MFRFANPHYLYLLAVIPLLIGLFVYEQRLLRRRLRAFGNPALLARLMPNVSHTRPHVKFGMLLVALALLIVALARPQFGSKLQTVKHQGVEAMIVLDVSNSMMAEDVQPNRLERSKMMLSKLIDQMNDDKIGLIVFAGDAYVQLPITADAVSAKMFLQSIQTNMVPRQGTAIGAAIDLAMRSFGAEQSDAGRTIIVITDGENHEDDAVAATKTAHERGVTVHVVGMGTPSGSPIPVNGTMSYRKDREGNVVVTKLNEEMCRQIASAGAGVYVRADNSNTALKALLQQIDKMQKGDLETQTYSEYDEKFYIFAWIALFLIVVEFFLYNRKNKFFSKIKWFD